MRRPNKMSDETKSPPSNAEPTIRVGTQDIPLSSITTVGEPRTTP